jgi:pimeloyl-ACP methyl ester carboxylesterase/GNAT superfamily N-acetyltransferase
MWSEHLAPVADAGYRVLAFDLPGFGQAPPGPEQAPWTDVIETMDALRIEHAVLIGNSFGGSVALSVAVLAAEHVRALMLVSALPPDLEPSAQLSAAWEAENAALDRGDIEAAVQAVVDAWTLPNASPRMRQRVASMQRRAFELQSSAELDGAVEVADPVEQNRAALGRLSIPVLVAAGELDMPDCRSGAAQLTAELPAARHVVIAGAGHLAPLEQPDAFRELLLDFLATVSVPSGRRPTIAVVGGDDFEDLLALVRAYCDFYEVSPSDAALIALFEALAADPVNEGLQLIARGADSRPLGFATLYWTWSTTRAARIGVMNDLFVVPEARGLRVGEQLIEACREQCRVRGAVSHGWQTAIDNDRAQRLYDRIGGVRQQWLDYSLPATAEEPPAPR